MGGMKDYAHRLREQQESGIDVGGLQGTAELLSGEVDGKFVCCPSIGRPKDDRSCRIIFHNPSNAASFFIYECEGSKRDTADAVRKKLNLVMPLRTGNNSAIALRIWSECGSAKGTLVEKYLRSRAITLEPPNCLRFHPALRHPESGQAFPAMVALVANQHDSPVAIHRTWLKPDGSGKAPIAPDKMTLGPISGSAIRLAPFADELLVGEGIETCLSAMQETGKPTWSACSAYGIRQLVLPRAVRKVTVLADGDDAGEAASLYAARLWQLDGIDARIARAPWGYDFNDVLTGKVAQ
jgi:hypothetical protein